MINHAILDALGDNWMYRNDNDGKGHNGFAWSPVGEWTVCPKWSDKTVADCKSGGLFGQGPGGYGHSKSGNRLVLCETRGPRLSVDGDKIKVREARILYVDDDAIEALAYLTGGWLKGSLDLRGTGITSLPDGLHVGGSLYLRGTGITSLPDGLHVVGDLDLRDTGITSLPDGLHVGGDLYLRDIVCGTLSSARKFLKGAK